MCQPVVCCNGCILVDCCECCNEGTCGDCLNCLCCCQANPANTPWERPNQDCFHTKCCCSLCEWNVCPCCCSCLDCGNDATNLRFACCVCSCCCCIWDPCAICFGPYKGMLFEGRTCEKKRRLTHTFHRRRSPSRTRNLGE